MKIKIEYSSGIKDEEVEVKDVAAYVEDRWGHIDNLKNIGGKIVVVEVEAAPVEEALGKRVHAKKV
jgi:hypothetical protein